MALFNEDEQAHLHPESSMAIMLCQEYSVAPFGLIYLG